MTMISPGELDTRWLGHRLVVGDDDRLDLDLARCLPEEAGRVTVLLVERTHSVEAVEAILRTNLPPGARSIRLVSSGASTNGLAQHLADSLGIEVVAPTEPVLLTEPGVLFVTGPRGAWRIHCRDREPVRDGQHFPAPAYPAGLPKVPVLRRGALCVQPLPAGFWLFRGRRASATVPMHLYAIEPSPHRAAVVVGCPGARPPSSRAIVAWLTSLLPTVNDLLLMPYGPFMSLADKVAARLTDRVAVSVERTGGLPTKYAGRPYFAVHDGDGAVSRPIVQSVRYDGGVHPRISSWIDPGSGGLAALPDQRPVTRLEDGLSLEVVHTGLWLHDSDAIEPTKGSDLFVVDIADAVRAAMLAQQVLGGLPADVADRLQLKIIYRSTEERHGIGALEPEPGAAGKAAEAATKKDATKGAAAGPSSQPAAPGGRSVPRTLPTIGARFAPRSRITRDAAIGPPPLRDQDLVRAAPVTATPTTVVPPPVIADPPKPEHVQPPAPVRATSATTAAEPLPRRSKTSAEPPPLAAGAPILRRYDGPLPPAPARSTPDQQRRVREVLGGQFDVYARTVTHMLVHMPGMRPAAGEPHDALMADLVAVAAQIDGVTEAAERELRPCVASGLARLPTFIGPLIIAVPPGVAQWQPGEQLTAPALLRAYAQPPADLDGTCVLVFSLSGRRPDLLADRDAILFAPQTVFRVLEAGPERVALREVDSTGPTSLSDEHVREALTRFRIPTRTQP